MRPVLLALTILLAWSPAVESSANMSYAEASGHFVVGLLLVGVEDPGEHAPPLENTTGPVNLARTGFEVAPDHRVLGFVIGFEPTGRELALDDDLDATLHYQFVAELLDGQGESLATVRVSEPGAYPLCEVPTGGPYRLDLFMTVGLDVAWTVEVVGGDQAGATPC